MFSLTERAKTQLERYFAEQEKSPIRVYMAAGWGGPRLALALDEQRENDKVFDVDGFTFLVEESLFDSAAPITVDLNEMGFIVRSKLPMDASGGCSSCTSCG